MPRERRRPRNTRLADSHETDRDAMRATPEEHARSAARGIATDAGTGRQWRVPDGVLWSILSVLLLYVAIGFWPIIPVEGDEVAIANGAAVLAHTPEIDKSRLYRYHFQPLQYVVSAMGERVFGIDTLTSFGVLTLVGFASFFAFSSVFCSRQTGVSLPAAGIILLLFQETFSSAYYPNTSMVAAGLLAPAAVLMSRPTVLGGAVAGALVSLAVTSRLDMLLIVPALVLVAIAFRRDRIVACLAMAMSAGVCLLLLKFVLGVSLEDVLVQVREHKAVCTNAAWALRNYCSVFNPFLCVLCLAGIAVCVTGQRWRILLLSACGTLPLALAYGRSVTTPKYLLLAIPFFALPVAVAIQSVGRILSVRWRVASIVLLGGLFVQQYFPGLVGSSIVDYLKKPRGDVFWTADFYRLRSSFGLAPLMWNLAKSYGADQLAACEKDLRQFTSERQSGDIVAVTGGFWVANNALEYELRRLGFFPPSVGREPSGSEADANAPPWLVHIFRDKAGKAFKVYYLEEQEAGRRTPEAFLAHQSQIQPKPAGSGRGRPYSFFLFFWGGDRGFLNVPWRFQRVDCDLNNSPGQRE